ncbi:protein FAR1-RELATED SEQUENCE 2-like [Lolium perenne]|uniref:protein FAR1-RELATED SEQUENCE 2-like n=1 Tax=Lolium perenne TaxID=4522 RepID=UPI003A991368
MTGKTPMECRRIVDKFAQSFVQRRKENAELESLAELEAVQASLYTHKENSEPEGHMSSNITREEDHEGYADSNILEMHEDGASFAGENACPADNADYSNGNEHGNKEEDKYEEIIESVLNPEEPTAEEIEMDKMFANKKYPTMQEISEASTPTVGMEFDSKEDAFFFFAVYARRVGFAIKKDGSYESKKMNEISRQTFACNRCRDDTYIDSALRQRRTSRIVQTKCKVRMFVKEYIENELAKERKKIKNRDIEELLILFKEAREKMPGFTHSIDVDSDNRVKSLFWTDQIGKANYSKFGQFVSFDTTFSTNQYGMPFAPIIGVDNYGKTVVFGVGLLEDERANTFKWLFEEFLSAMENKYPETIITNQDVAMGIAISKALPYTIHRFCNFHITKNLYDNLSLFFAVRGNLKEELRVVIRNSFTPEEFQTEWHDLLQRHNALGEPHLDRIYEIRA